MHTYARQPGDTVAIALNDWASQRVLSRVYGILLERMGVESKFYEVKVEDQWGAFGKGLVDVQVEVWQAGNGRKLQSFVNKGLVVDAGDHIATAREEWWYPQYVKPMCPGLPQWQALKKCAHLFANDKSLGKGMYYTGPGNTNEGIRIRALELNFVIKRLENDMALWRILSRAMQAQEPIIMLNWTPNWTDTRIRGEFVEFPPFSEKCITDPSWGLNHKLPNDCGNPKDGWVKKLASTRLETKFPCAYKALQKIQFTTTMMAEAAALVISDKHSEAESAQHWIKMYELQWLSWLTPDCYR
jgi:glycine betaine/proline transport system substrate-binding protein